MNNLFWKRYYIGWCLLFLILSAFIVTWRANNYSEVKLRRMVDPAGKFTDTTTDPCKFLTSGTPNKPNKQNIKLLIICGDGREARNILSFAAVEPKTVNGLIREVEKVNGITKGTLDGWVCDVDGKNVDDFNNTLIIDSLVKCKK